MQQSITHFRPTATKAVAVFLFLVTFLTAGPLKAQSYYERELVWYTDSTMTSVVGADPAITSAVLPGTVVLIGDSAFAHCPLLDSVVVPTATFVIGSGAFDKVPHVVYHGTAAGSPWGAYCINGYVENGYVYTSVPRHDGTDTIASTLHWKTHIGDNGYTKVSHIVIPEWVRSVGGGNMCFLNNRMREFYIPDGVTSIVGWNAFYGSTYLRKLTIGNGIDTIPLGAFSTCELLTHITLSDSLKAIEQDAFYGGDATPYFSLNHVEIPASVTYIHASAFHCPVVIRQDGVGNPYTENGLYYSDASKAVLLGASEKAMLRNVEIPASVTSIDMTAFTACEDNFWRVSVNSANSVYDSRNNCNAIIETATNKLVAGASWAVIPDNVTSIGKHAFQSRAIYANSGNLIIPESVELIEYLAFTNCTGLNSIRVNRQTPPTLQVAALAGGGATRRDASPFDGVDPTIPVYVPEGTVAAYQNSSWGAYFTNFVEVVDYRVTFSDSCSGTTYSLVSARKSTFHDAQGRVFSAEVSAGGRLTVADHCDGTVPLTAIPDSGYTFMFWGDRAEQRDSTNPRTVSIDSLPQVNAVFMDTSLGSPSRFPYPCKDGQILWYSVTSDTTAEVYWDMSNDQMPTITFLSYPNLTGNIYIPSHVSHNGTTYRVDGVWGLETVSLPFGAFNLCSNSNIDTIFIPNSATYLSSQSFMGLGIAPDGNSHSFRAIVIGDSVRTIGRHAFYDCPSLSVVRLGKSLVNIGIGAFAQESCRVMDKIEYKGSENEWLGYWNTIATNSINSYSDSLEGGIGAASLFKSCPQLNRYPHLYFYHEDYWDAYFYEAKDIEITSNYSSIENHFKFYSDLLNSVIVPSFVNSVAPNAFEGTRNLVVQTNASGAPWGAKHWGRDWDPQTGYFFTDNTRTTLFGGVSTVRDFVSPSTVRTIGEEAFMDYDSLMTITLNEGLDSIGPKAFANCVEVDTVYIPRSVRAIGDSAFLNVWHVVYYPGLEGAPWGAASADTMTDYRVTFSDTCSSTDYRLLSARKSSLHDEQGRVFSAEVSEGGRLTVADHCDGTVTLTAVPDSGYTFMFWGDRAEQRDSTNPRTVSIDSLPQVNAIFMADGEYSASHFPYPCKDGQILWYNVTSDTTVELSYGTMQVVGTLPLYENLNGNIYIPDNVVYNNRNYRVTDVCGRMPLNGAFVFALGGNCWIDTIFIPNSMKRISSPAFSWVNTWGLEKDSFHGVIIGDSVVSIGAYSFNGNKYLGYVKLGRSVRNIWACAFDRCNIKTVAYDGSISEWLNQWNAIASSDSIQSDESINGYEGSNGSHTLFTSQQLSNIPTANLYLRNSRTAGYDKVVDVEVPEEFTTIHNHFKHYSSTLHSVILFNTVTNVDSNALAGVRNVVSFGTTVGTPWGAKRWGTDWDPISGLFYVDNTRTTLFGGKSTVTRIDLPTTVSYIGEEAFEGYDSLLTLTLNDSLDSIGPRAFAGCTALDTVFIPRNVSHIGDSAFLGVPNIIYYRGLEGAPWGALNSIEVSDSLVTVHDENCAAVYTRHLSDRKARIYTNLPAVYHILTAEVSEGGRLDVAVGCDGTYTLTATPDSGYCFMMWGDRYEQRDSTNPRTISIDSLTHVNAIFMTDGNYTANHFPYPCADGQILWYSATSDSTVEVTQTPGQYGLYSGLHGNLYIPNRVTHNGISYRVDGIWGSWPANGAFRFTGILNCYIDTIFIPNSVTYISDVAFIGVSLASGYSNGSFNGVIIGDSVKSIGAYAFSDNMDLHYVKLGRGIEYIWSQAFNYCTKLDHIEYEGSISAWMEYWNRIVSFDSIRTVVAGSTVRTDARSVFRPGFSKSRPYLYLYGQKLIDAVIPYGTSLIKPNAFKYYSDMLVSAILPETMQTVADSTFEGTRNLVTLGTTAGAPWGAKRWGTDWDPISGLFYVDDTRTTLFGGKSTVTEIYAPASVKYIGEGAFEDYLDLDTVVLPSGLDSIGARAFANCTKLTSVVIPDSVSKIGEDAFLDVYNIVYHGSATGAPWGARSMNGHLLDSLVYSDRSKTVVVGCHPKLRNAIVPNGVERIAEGAFSGMVNLRTLHLGADVYDIGGGYASAFEGCRSLVRITVDTANQVLDSRGDCNAVIQYGVLVMGCKNSVLPDDIIGIGANAFKNVTELRHVKIGRGVQYVHQDAFLGCSGITSLSYEAVSCTSMGTAEKPALRECGSLSRISFGDSVRHIAAHAFRGQGGIRGTVSLPATLQSIGTGAFAGCNGIDTVRFAGTLRQWCEMDFASEESVPSRYSRGLYLGNTLVTRVDLPEGTTHIADNVFRDDTNIVSVVIPSTVTRVGGNAFGGCPALRSVTFNADSCTYMGSVYRYYNAYGRLTYVSYTTPFSSSNSITSLTIGANVKSIPDFAFAGLSHVRGTLTIPSGLTYLGEECFAGCTSYDTIDYRAVAAVPGTNAFSGDTAVSVVRIGAEVTALPADLFADQRHLERTCFDGTALQWNAIDFGNAAANPVSQSHNLYIADTLLRDVVISDNDTAVKPYIFCGDTALRSLTMGLNAATVGTDAFRGCDSIKRVVWNARRCEGLTFKNNTVLTSVTIGDSVRNLYCSMFDGCTNLNSIEYRADSVSLIGCHYCPSCNNNVFRNIASDITINLGAGIRYMPDNLFFNADSGYTAHTYYEGTPSQWVSIVFGGATANPVSLSRNLYIADTLLRDVVIDDDYTAISPYLFYGDTALRSLTLGLNLANVGTDAFHGCDSLREVVWNARNLSGLSFNSHNGITTLTIGDSVRWLPASTFANCTSIATINFLADSMNSGSNCISGLAQHVRLNIGTGVRYIGGGYMGNGPFTALSNKGATTHYAGSPQQWNAIVFGSLYANPVYRTRNLYIADTLLRDVVFDTAIGDFAFARDTALRSLTVGRGVTSFGNQAFYQCSKLSTLYWNADSCDVYTGYPTSTSLPTSISTLVFGDNVRYIGDFAFRDMTKLKRLTIPRSMENIGTMAFSGCTGLDTIWWNADSCYRAGNTNTNANAAFRLANLKAIIIGDSVRSLPNNVFLDCTEVDSLRLGASLHNIGSSAFNGMHRIKHLAIENSVRYIGMGAFSGWDSLQSIYWNADSCVLQYGSAPFAGSSVTRLTFGDSVYYLNGGTFGNMTGLHSVTIPRQMRMMNGAFGGSAIDTVLWLADSCMGGFRGTSVKHVTIGRNVRSLPGQEGNPPFGNCDSLWEVLWLADSCGGSPFYGSATDFKVTIGDSVRWTDAACFATIFAGNAIQPNTTVGEVVWLAADCQNLSFHHCGSLHKVTIGPGVRTLPTNVFQAVTVQDTVYYLSDSLESNNPLFRTSSLGVLSIGANVRCWPSQTFNNISGIGQTHYGGTLQQWMDIDFASSSANPVSRSHNLYLADTLLTDLVIPDGVTQMKPYLFYNDTALHSVSLPASLDTLQNSVFSSCSGLHRTAYRGTLEQWLNMGFSNSSANPVCYSRNLYIADTLLTDLVIADGVTRLKPYLFYYDTALHSVSLPASIDTLRGDVFYNCNGLRRTTFRGSVEQWLNIGFDNYTSNPVRYSRNLYIGDTLLTDLAVPAGIDRIKKYTFYYDTCLRSVTIDSATIGDNSFYRCGGLRSVKAGKGTIGDNAFYYCSSLQSAVIGGSQMGNYAFYGCSSLLDVSLLQATPPSKSNYTFTLVTGRVYHIPCGSLQTYRNAWGTSYTYEEGIAFDIRLTMNVEGAGSATVTAQDNCAMTATVLCTPAPGYTFDHWSDGSTENPYTLTLVGDTALTAVCRDWCTFVARPNIAWAGDIIVDGTTRPGDTVTVTAIPTEGCRFAYWPDGDTNRSHTFVVHGDTVIDLFFYTDNLTANFEDGEADTLWQHVNHGGTDWYFGNAVPGNSRCMYISNDDGLTWHYDSTAASTSYAYVDLYLEQGLFEYSFDWRNMGNYSGYLSVVLMPDDAAMNQTYYYYSNGNKRLASSLYGDTTGKTVSGFLDVDETRGYRLAFVWYGRTSTPGVNPPAAVDNILLKRHNTVELVVLSADSSQGTVTGSGSYGYRETAVIEAIPAEGYTFYRWNDDNRENPRAVELWRSDTAIATFVKATLTDTLICNFEDSTDATKLSLLFNSNYKNRWCIGPAADTNYGNSLYISDDGGLTNNYTINSSSYVIATVPMLLDTGKYEIKYDWRAYGERNYDYLRITLSTGMTASEIYTAYQNMSYYDSILPESIIDLCTSCGLNNAWTHFVDTITLQDSGLYELSFTWINDGTMGTQKPAAIDNISVIRNPMPHLYTICDNNMGRVDGGGAYPVGTEVTATAVAAPCHYFVGWSDGVTENPRQVTVTTDVTVEALFAAEETAVGSVTATACDSYLWKGDTLTTSGSYQFDTLTVAGCDSIVTLALTVNYSNLGGTATATACDSYVWKGDTLTENGSYPFDTLTVAGCDSIVTLALTVNYSDLAGTTSATACDSYMWKGDTLTVSGSYTFDTLTVAGCDSTVTLALTVNYSDHSGTATATACDSYLWKGDTLTESGSYQFDTLNVVGCDSTVTLTLTINNSNTNGTATATACDSYVWKSDTLTVSGSYPFDTLTVAGCDSTVTLALTVNYSDLGGTATATTCDSYLWKGDTLTASGNYSYDTLTMAGCDSTVTLALTVNYSDLSGTATATACDSYVWKGDTLTASGSYPYDTLTVAGCDSTVTLALTVNYSDLGGTATATACDSYVWKGDTLTASGSYPYDTLTVAGCDSTVTLALTVNYSDVGGTATATACDSYLWKGDTLTASGSYPYDTLSVAGCDSTVTLALTINYSDLGGTATATACDSYVWKGNTLTASGSYPYDTLTVAGCDSTVTLTLTINYSTSADTAATACDSYSWYEHVGLTTSQNVSHTFYGGNAYGCDSTVVLALTVNHSSVGDTSATACDSYSWYEHVGITTSRSVTHLFAGGNAAGCDSTVTLTLTVNYSNLGGTAAATACDSYVWKGNTLTASGSYPYDTLTVAGCDSTVTLALTINSSDHTGTAATTACDSYVWKGNTLTASGSYPYDTLTVAGCDSTVTLALTINNSTFADTAATACDSYSWYEHMGMTTSRSVTHLFAGGNASGCDSTVTLTLTVNYSNHTGTAAATTCDSYVWKGNTLTVSGSYPYDTLTVAGCDSTVTLALIINYSDHTGTATATACDSYVWKGNTLTESGSYPFDTLTVAGCDSTVTLALTINYSVYDTIELTGTDSVEWNGTMYSESGTYIFYGTAVNGCDSIVTANITVIPTHYYTVSVTCDETQGSVDGGGIFAEGDTCVLRATANEGYHFVAWMEGSDIASADSVYTFVVVRDFTLIAIFGEDTSNHEGIGEVEVLAAKVYADGGQIVVEGAEGHLVTLYDVNGRVLATKRDDYAPLRFDVRASGTYMIKISNYPARKIVVIR